MAVTERAAPVRGFVLGEALRSFATAVRLGWAVESNWSDPFLFALYSLAKPIAAALILVVMFQIISGGRGTEYLQYLVVGAALWNVVFGVMGGLVQTILEDRERYRMMKYVVVTPSSLLPFLLGRSLARVGVSVVAVAVTIGVGIIFLGVELQPNLMLVPGMLIGVVGVMAIGLFMAGWCLQLRQEAWSYPEAIAGALYLVSGAIFPIEILPELVQPLARAFPTTWWLEASRRGLLGHGSPGAIGALSNETVLLTLTVTTAVTIAISVVAYAWFVRRARQAGLLDMITGS